MHRLRFILRHNSAFRKHLSDSNVESFSRTFIRDFKTYRMLQTDKLDDSGDSENPGKETVATSAEKAKNERSNRAKAKLNTLLQSIVQDSKKDATSTSEKNLKTSAIDMKLAVPEKEKPVPKDKNEQSADEKETEQDLGKDMVAAVKQVAESIDNSNPDTVESELVQKLKTQVGKKVNLSDLFAGMKIDRSSKDGSSALGDMELSRAHRVRRLLDERTDESKRVQDRRGASQTPRPRQRRMPVSTPTYVPIDLFGAPPLGIFPVKTESKASEIPEPKAKVPRLETWEILAARDLKLSVTHPPANGFEEMILWTEQGKLWKFPIDNEQGLDEEGKVPFHEHVFLEPQIEGWCPKKGPIRHFMELVCVGLSKNPFLTVKEKHEQIEWYHQYFKEKASIIKEVGAGEIK